jgi:hypothetical protein
MAAIALNPAGGSAVVVSAKVPDADLARLIRLAAEAGVTKSVIMRQLVARGLDQLEKEAARTA